MASGEDARRAMRQQYGTTDPRKGQRRRRRIETRKENQLVDIMDAIDRRKGRRAKRVHGKKT